MNQVTVRYIPHSKHYINLMLTSKHKAYVETQNKKEYLNPNFSFSLLKISS
jgi:hypothetical protein